MFFISLKMAITLYVNSGIPGSLALFRSPDTKTKKACPSADSLTVTAIATGAGSAFVLTALYPRGSKARDLAVKAAVPAVGADQLFSTFPHFTQLLQPSATLFAYKLIDGHGMSPHI